MTTVTDADVKALVDTQRDTTPFIATANLIASENLATAGYSDARLYEITKYLAAHFTTVTEENGGVTLSRIGEAVEKYNDLSPGDKFGFKATRFGLMAISLDTSGILQSMSVSSGLSAQFSMIAYPKCSRVGGW